MARQRVDNFAAGFVKAGASAVVAEAYDDPNHMVRAVLSAPRLHRVGLAACPVGQRQHLRFRELP